MADYDDDRDDVLNDRLSPDSEHDVTSSMAGDVDERSEDLRDRQREDEDIARDDFDRGA